MKPRDAMSLLSGVYGSGLSGVVEQDSSEGSAAGVSIVSMIETKNDLKPIKSKFLINKKVDGTKMYSSLKESTSDLEIGSLKTLISQRQSYIRTIANNQTIFNGSDNKAIAEIELLAKK